MNRRQMIAALGGAAAWPLAARTQQPTKPMIALLHIGIFRRVGDAFRRFPPKSERSWLC